MNDRNSLGLTVLHGTLDDLYIENGEEEFVRDSNEQLAASGAAVGPAVAGLAGAATNALFAAGGGADSVQNFTATLDGQRIAGRFSKIGFQNGDALEVVAQPQEDGSFAAYAVRRSSDQTLWMFPHCSRGRKTHWKYAWKMALILSITLSLLSFVLLFILAREGKYSQDSEYILFPAAIWTILSITMGTYFSLNTARRWMRFVNIAEEIFAVLGYKDPANIDMSKQDSIYWKNSAKPGEQRTVAPWVYRYVNEP